MKTYTLPLHDPNATLKNVGGKGMSLAKMINAEFPIPDGYHITTEAYRQFVTANDLQTKILAALKEVEITLPATLETTSATIGRLFADAKIPNDIASTIAEAYATLLHSNPSPNGKKTRDEGIPVAVRSSATAEDLPEASFAGQQETYLNIRGDEAVLEAVKKCWASLWTARAIAYRIKNNIDQNSIALAVVVQEMVDAEAAGILFTANPMNGRRDEMVINAAWGLGEAIVGGLVSPDTIIADKTTGKVKKMDIAKKTVITVTTEKGTGEKPLNDARRNSQVMKEVQVIELANIARRIESFYGSPQDIEWCYSAGHFYIVQSRPITALPEPPLEWPLPHPKAVLARGSFAEFVPEPMSPLFATLAVPLAREASTKLMNKMGVTVKDSYIFAVVNSYLYIGMLMTPKMTWQMMRGSFAMLGSMLKTSAQQAEAAGKKFLGTVQKWQTCDLNSLMPSELLAGVRDIFSATAEYYTMAQSATIPTSMTSEATFGLFYNSLVKRKGDPNASTFVYGSENQAMRAEKALFDLTMWMKEEPELADYLIRLSADDFCAALQADPQPVPALGEFATRFNGYLHEFGHAIYDLDFAKPTPSDSPAPLIETMKVYLSGKNNPHERQRLALEHSSQAAETIVKRLDPLRRKYFIKLLKWAQGTAPLRENSIADLGLGHPQIRRMLGEFGKRLTTGDAIACANDVYWLEAQEVDALASLLEKGETLQNFFTDVENRKTNWEAMRHIIPPNTLPQKTWISKFYASNEQTGDTIKGFGASVGKVTARACVMLGPEDFDKMQAGDVIVAGITTPAWTPLFARASAIVTDIGGPLSHSSIVAREYGIPAVLGTSVATRRIHSGDTIEVNGTEGKIYIKTPGTTGEPAVEWTLPRPKLMLARGSLAEHLPNVVSPLFGTLGLRQVNKATLELGDFMGGIDLLEVEYQYRIINGYVYFGFLMTVKFMWTMIKVTFTSLKLMYTQSKERWLEARGVFANTITPWERKQVESLSPSELLEGVRTLMYAAGKYYTVIQSSTLPSASSSEIIFTSVYKMVSRKDEPKAATLLFGLETVPLRAEKSLFDLGMWIREHPALREFMLHVSRSTDKLVTALQADSAPEGIPAEDWTELKSRLEKHFEEFGHTSFEFDFMNPTPAETPELVLDSLKMYVEGKGSDPYARQREVTEKREQTLRMIRNRFKLIPNRWFDKAVQWAIDTGPSREDSLADMGMGHTTVRRMLGELGKRYVANGALEDSDDIYWLVEDEVDKLASLLERNQKLPDYSSKVSVRKVEWRGQMKLNPPPMLPATSRWAKLIPWARQNESGNVIKGLGASAGKVTANACVMFAPEDFSRMKPGNVLVAVTTTPAWTPLFAMASAIVTDIGGPLSHSSIVAREYGIPAVLATGNGTRLIHNGQTITVDGGAGIVSLN